MDILPVTSRDYGPMTTYSWNCTKEFEVAATVNHRRMEGSKEFLVSLVFDLIYYMRLFDHKT